MAGISQSENSSTVNRASVEKAKGNRGRDLISVGIGVIVCVYYLLFISGLLNRMRIFPHIVSHQALILGLVSCNIFMFIPAKKGQARDTLPWYDIICIALILLVTLYPAFFYDTILDHWQIQDFTWYEKIFGLLAIVLVLETGRRTVGWAMVGVTLFFIFHALYSSYFPGFLRGPGQSLDRLTSYMYMTQAGLWGPAMNAVATIVIIYIILGKFFEETGAGAFFTDVAFSLIGRYRGGAAKVSVIASGAMGSVMGATTANVVTTGTLTIPMMKKSGYPPHFAAGVEAVASNGGQIMPPIMGAVPFIMAQILGMPYLDICVAAALPAILYFVSLLTMVDLEAAKLGIKGLARGQLPSLVGVLKDGWFYYLVPLAILLFSLTILLVHAEMAGLYGLLSLYVLCLFKKGKRMGPMKVIKAFESVSKTLAQVIPAVAMAGIIIGCVSLTGVAYKLSAVLVSISGGSILLLLVLCAVSSFFLGMGMTSIPCYLVLVILVAPTLADAGVPLIAAHLFMFWFGLVSFITPPVAIAAYIASAIAESDPFKTGWTATRLGLATFILPFMFVYNPALLLRGDLAHVALAVFTSLIGIMMLASGLSGYGFVEMRWWERGICFVGAICLIFAGWGTDLLGGAFLLAVLATQYSRVRGVGATA